MRFTQFLIEQDDQEQRYQQAAQTLLNDCRPYFEELGYDITAAMSLFRGLKTIPQGNQLLYKKDVRVDRKPTDTPVPIQQYLDQTFQQQFGVPFRSKAMYTTGSRLAASYYGTLCIVFPIGQFKYLWSSEVEDLFGRIRDRVLEQSDDESFELFASSISQHYQTHGELTHDVEEMIDDILDEANYQDDQLKQAIQSRNEIMIATDQYYIIPFDDKDGRLGVHRALEHLVRQQ